MQIPLPGMKYYCQAGNIAARKETLLVITRTVETDWHLKNIVAWREILLSENRYCCLDRKIVSRRGNIVARQEISLVDHTDDGDGLAPDKYCCLERNIVVRKEISLVDHTDSGVGLATDKYCCLERNIVVRKDILMHESFMMKLDIVARQEILLVDHTVETDWHLINIVPSKEILLPGRKYFG